MNTRPPALDPETTESFVSKAHGDLDGVLRYLEVEPALANVSWDWGGGDWETALGAAAHMGRRDIALTLLEGGARLDVFAAAMLGHTQIVGAILTAFPQMRDGLGLTGSRSSSMREPGASGRWQSRAHRDIGRAPQAGDERPGA